MLIITYGFTSFQFPRNDMQPWHSEMQLILIAALSSSHTSALEINSTTPLWKHTAMWKVVIKSQISTTTHTREPRKSRITSKRPSALANFQRVFRVSISWRTRSFASISYPESKQCRTLLVFGFQHALVYHLQGAETRWDAVRYPLQSSLFPAAKPSVPFPRREIRERE